MDLLFLLLGSSAFSTVLSFVVLWLLQDAQTHILSRLQDLAQLFVFRK